MRSDSHHGWTVAVLLSMSACERPPSDANQPPAVQPTQKSLETDGPQTVLTKFLDARWRFDGATAQRFVTASDREHVHGWAFHPFGERSTDGAHASFPEGWFEWRLGEVRETPNEVRADVEVVLTTDDARRAHIRESSRLDERWSPFESGGSRARRAISTALLPDRRVVPMTYRLVKEDGEWVVQMGWAQYSESHWSHFMQAPSQYEVKDDDELTPLADFDGSESWWLEEAHRTRDALAAVTNEQRELSSDVAGAEKLKNEAIDDAVAAYGRILARDGVPAFLKTRRGFLMKTRDARQAALAEAKLELHSEGPRRGAASRLVVPLTLKNGGPHRVRSLTVQLPIGKMKPSKMFRNLAPGAQEVQDVEASLPVEVAEACRANGAECDRLFEEIEVGTPRLAGVTFEDEAMRKRYGDYRSEEFLQAFADLQTGGRTRNLPSHVGFRVRTATEELDRCPDWPAAPVLVRLDVGRDGKAQSTQILGPSAPPPFAECISKVVESIEHPECEEDWGVVIQLVPAGFVEALAEQAEATGQRQ